MNYKQVGWLVHWYDEEDRMGVLFSPTEHRAGKDWSEPVYIAESSSYSWRRWGSKAVQGGDDDGGKSDG